MPPGRATSISQVFPGGGEMGDLARSVDWSGTAVGAVEGWPQSLRTALSIIFDARFPMLLCWGPEFVQFYNDPFRPILGTRKHPALGRSTRETFAEAWHIIGPLFEQVMDGSAVGFEDMLVPLDRHGFLEECYFSYSYSPIRDETGGVAGILVTCTETTARLLAERRLRTLGELASRAAGVHDEESAWAGAMGVLRAAAADLPFAALYALDPDGRTARLAGSSPSPLAPSTIAADDPSPVWPLLRPRAALPRLIDVDRGIGAPAESPWPEPIREAMILPITRPGLPHPYGLLVAGLSPRLALDDKYREFLSLAADQIAMAVANARAYEEERRRTEALLQLDREKTAFFSNVSHEFRTPLTLLLGPVEHALERTPVRMDAGDVALVHRNALRLLRLVNTLLDFARIEAGRAEAHFDPIELGTFTREIASTFGSLMDGAGLAFEIDCPPCGSTASVDADMWEKIVLNLLSNAFKFTRQGTIAVRLREHSGGFELTVEDSGCGIPPAELPRIFDRFHRVPGAPSRTFEGSGIGLALVREMVRMHGGDISVESEEGQGTRFRVRIPATGTGRPAAAPRGLEPRGVTARPFLEEARHWSDLPETPAPATPADPHTRILVVDDNADMRQYLRRLLATHWCVDEAVNGREALARVAVSPPDIILSDVMMPDMDGFELLRRLRANDATRVLPVMLLSARAGEDASVEGLVAGADDYVVKPFSARELVARVRTRLEVSRLRRETAAQNRRLEALVAAAEEASQAKDRFLAMLGHELRNPLAPILTALQLMKRRGDTGVERERAIIERQVHHVRRLVDDLLDVSRITQGHIELRRERVELSSVVAKAMEMTTPLIARKQHVVVTDVEPAGLAIDGDPTRLQQVVMNLVNNAAKYTDPGGRIAVTARRAGAEVLLKVVDSGIGIEPPMLTRIFELFVQEHEAVERGEGGLGLGLSIVRNLVELHGGRVSVASPGRNQGTEFIVYLPAAPEEIASA